MTQDTLTMTIGGKAASSANSLDVCNPATGQVFAAVPDAGAAELEAAITAARSAFPAWRDTAWADRAAIVNRIGETIAANAAELAAMLTREQGKPAEQAQFEVMAAAQEVLNRNNSVTGWLTRAAELGLVDSQFNIAKLYETGEGGVRTDPIQAFKWYLIASRAGDGDAQAAVDRLRATLSTTDRGKARADADRFTVEPVA